MSFTQARLPAFALALIAAAPAAHAQFAVIDLAAVTQLVTEVRSLEQALTEAKAELGSITGNRGMAQLLAGIDRNYLPTGWPQLSAALGNGGSGYPSLAAAVQQALAADAVLTPQQVATLSPDRQQQLTADRQTAAMLQALSRQALANSSDRFTGLQQLISAIGATVDQKGILELVARIGAEQTMLENEQTKLRVLIATAASQRWADEEQERERAVAAEGEFATRFQPTP